MSEPYVAQITMFAGNFAPRGWAFCDGQLLAVSQNDALFSLLGTIYGGDGRTTFGLPDLRGRAAMHAGNGPGLSSYRLGAKGGQERVTLTTNQMPSHNHDVTMRAEMRGGSVTDPAGNMLAAGSPIYRGNAAADDVDMDPGMIRQGNVGGSQPHNNLSPFLAVNYIIALFGIYPSRS